jgi:prepilin-type processing-associated H-X9-DG protein
LVEGDPLADYLQESKIVSAEGDAILHAVMSLVNSKAKEALDGYSEDPHMGGIWVTALQVADMAERLNRRCGSMRVISKTLKSFGDGATPNRRIEMTLPNGRKSGRKNYFFLDGSVLLKSAATMGYDTSRLEKLVEKHG